VLSVLFFQTMQKAFTEYPAQAFSDSLPNGRASGCFRVEAEALVFNVQTRTILVPLNGLQLKLGGAANRLIFISHTYVPDWQFYTADTSFLDAPLLQDHPEVQGVRVAKRRHHGAVWAGVGAAVMLLILSVLGIYWSLDGASALAARRIPAAWELKLGESAFAQYRLQHEFMDDKQAVALLTPLTRSLTAALPDSRYTMRFHIVDDPAINAFALPGGYMVINTGLILNARRAEELQGVLAHEISHVTEQHGLRSVIRGTGVFVIAQAFFGDASGLLALLANAGPVLLNQTYSRDFEREADAKAYGLLTKAQINPHGMTDFFRVILAEEKKALAKIEDANTRELIDKTKGFVSSHPDTEERIANLEKQMAKDQKSTWRNDQEPFLALKQAVQVFVSEKQESEKK